MDKCKCGSFAINPHLHGRDATDLDLCDVCYWRKRASSVQKQAMREKMQFSEWWRDNWFLGIGAEQAAKRAWDFLQKNGSGQILEVLEGYFQSYKKSCYCDYDNEVGAGSFLNFIRKHHKK